MNVKPLTIRSMARLGMHSSLFGVGLIEIAQERDNLYAMTADMGGYSGLDRFKSMYPEKFINVGIQEQNMIGIACGLALEGKTVFVTTYSAFSLVRAMEQVRHNMSVLNTDIKLVGHSSGYTMETLGRSHWATEDLAFTRALPNFTVISAADSLEAVKAGMAAAELPGPVYIRLCGAGNCTPVYQEDYDFEIGKGITLREGSDTVIVATGRMVNEALKAAEILSAAGFSAQVVNIHTIKPIDETLILSLAERYSDIFTVEEHNIIGGLGSAVAELLAENPGRAVLHRLGMRDRHYELGKTEYMWRQAGVCGDQIAETVQACLQKRV